MFGVGSCGVNYVKTVDGCRCFLDLAIEPLGEMKHCFHIQRSCDPKVRLLRLRRISNSTPTQRYCDPSLWSRVGGKSSAVMGRPALASGRLHPRRIALASHAEKIDMALS